MTTANDTTYATIHEHYYGTSHVSTGEFSERTACPVCRGAYSLDEASINREIREAWETREVLYIKWLGRVSDIDLQAVLLTAQTHKIAAIKMLRSITNYGDIMPLGTAKRIVEECKVETVVTYNVIRVISQ
jgi:hypothetical protein